jgi:hypothetical protein
MHDYSILGHARKLEWSEIRCLLLGSGMVNMLGQEMHMQLRKAVFYMCCVLVLCNVDQ